MSAAFVFNPFTGNFDTVNTSPAGDIAPTNFSASQSASAATVTGFTFSGYQGFEATVSVHVSATTPLRQSFRILGALNGAGSWVINTTTAGDESGFTFTINSSGQLLYSSGSYTGFTAAVINFRGIALSS